MEEEVVVKTKSKMKKNEIKHIASFTSGILSIVFAFIWYLGIAHGILAIVFGANIRSKYKSKLGTAGFILRNYRSIFWSYIFDY